jgi:tetratricopeptide (TPR) repeat protein
LRCRAVVLVAFLFLLLVSPCLAQSNINAIEIQPLNCDQVMALLAGGVSIPRVEQMVLRYGISFHADDENRAALQEAGAESGLLTAVSRSKSALAGSCSTKVMKAAGLVRKKDYEAAEVVLRKLVADDPANAALHFALAYARSQQGDWDEAFDEYSEAKRYMPALPEVHSRLAYDFYVSNDGDNTIAEARTALSLDPRNAEGYRDLGLGLTLSEKFDAAQHAFEESLRLQKNNPETYFGIAKMREARHDSVPRDSQTTTSRK